MTLPGAPPVPTDSTNERQHRQQIAQCLNSLNKKVFESDGTIKQSIVDLTTTVTSGDATLSAAISSEASVRASADSAQVTLITTETANRTSADSTLNSAITTESTARVNGDSANATAISTETANRTTADNTISASVTTEATARVNGDNALSSSLTTVSTTVSGHTASISTLSSSVSGLNAQWGVSIDINGNVVGQVKLDGTASTSEFKVRADKFTVYDGVSSTTPAFQITGGVAYLNVPLKTNAVGTGNIAAAAVNGITLQAVSGGNLLNASGSGDTSCGVDYKSPTAVYASTSFVEIELQGSYAVSGAGSLAGSVICKRSDGTLLAGSRSATAGSTQGIWKFIDNTPLGSSSYYQLYHHITGTGSNTFSLQTDYMKVTEIKR